MSGRSNTTLGIEITADNRKAKKGLKDTSGDLDKLDGSLKRTRQSSRGLSDALAAVAVGAAVRDVSSAGSDLAEATSKAEVVFGNASASVLQFGEDAEQGFGQSKAQALDAAATYGNLLRAIGLTEAQSAEYSTTLTGLASDLASFNNTSVDDAIQALRSGLSGETEPLKRYGINLNDARLKQEALNQGLYDGKGVLDVSAKAQAAYALILQDSTLAQGDFTRTSDGMANKQRILAAEFENSKAALGQGLTPVLLAATKTASGALKVFSGFPKEVQLGIVALTGFGAVASRVTDRLGDGGMSGALTRSTGDFGKLNSAVAAGVVGLTAYGIATQALNDSVKFGGDIEGLTTDIGDLGKGLITADEALQEFKANKGPIVAGNQLGEVVSGVDALALSFKALDESNASDLLSGDFLGQDKGQAKNDIAALDEVLASLASSTAPEAESALADIVNALQDQGISIEKVMGRLPNYAAALDRAGRAERDAAREGEGLVNIWDKSAKAAEAAAAGAFSVGAGLAAAAVGSATLAKSEEDRVDQVRAARDAERSMEDATRSTAEAITEQAEAQRAARGDSDEYRQAVEAIADARQGVVDAENAVRDAQQDALQTQGDLNDARAEAKVRIDDLAQAARKARDEEADAALRAREAQAEAAKIAADPRRSKLERERAALDAILAQNDAREVGLDAIQAQDEATDAARRGVEGDERVVAAKQAIVDANAKVVEAQGNVADAAKRVGESERAAAQVITDAKARVVESARNVEDAMYDEADAAAALAEAHGAAAGGVDAQVAKLLALSATMDPNGELRTRTREFAAELMGIGNTPGGGAIAGGIIGAGLTANITQINQGTPTQQRRAAANAALSTLNNVIGNLR